MDDVYQAPAVEGKIKFIDYKDLEVQASKILSSGAWGYLFEGAGDNWTLRQNTEAFNYLEIYPRVLSGVENPDLHTSILGIDLKMPIIMAPAAAQGLEHVGGETQTARGVAEAGTLMAISNYANELVEDISVAAKGAPQWFQLYMSKKDDVNKRMLDAALAAKVKAIILTADATVGGNREADIRNNFKMPLKMANLEKYSAGKGLSINDIFANTKQKLVPEDVGKIAEYTKLPVIVKGIQCAEDALLAIGSGAAAIYVSNHGGRQLDGGPASIEVLSEIAEAVNKKVPIIFDSGIRRAQHIFKALASGADIVAIGRPALYGLTLGGWQGVKQVFEYFANELAMVMQLAGTQNIEAVKQSHLR